MASTCLPRKRLWLNLIGIALVEVLWGLLPCASVPAQEVVGVYPGIRPPEILPPVLEEKQPVLPNPPDPSSSSDTREKPPGEAPLERTFVGEIKITGNTVFSEEELAEVTKPYTNRQLSALDLESLRRALTLYYINKGYINSGAMLPDQEIVGGVVTFKIVEGQLNDIEVEGNKWLRRSYYQNRVALGAGPPLNIESLQEKLQLLQQDDRVQQLHGELRPGVKPGESELKLKVEEALPFSVVIGANNYQSPTVGAAQGFASLADRSLTGNGDILSLTYWNSGSFQPQIDVWYAFPLTARDTTLTLRYRKNNLTIVEAPFQPLDIVTESDIYEINLRQPLVKNLNHELAIGLTGDYINNQTFLLDEPFSFYLGAQNGKSTVSALRFFQEWIYRTQTRVVAARSRFSFGLDAFDATINPSPLPDSQFFVWLGQFQWAQIIKPWDIQAILRTDLQVSNNPLLPVEQIPVGGRYSVRGYIENQLVRDNGLIASLEMRIPLVRDKRWADYLQLAPFFDFGKAWNTYYPTLSPKNLAGVGLGLRWGMTAMKNPFPIRPEFEIYWGYPLVNVETQGNGLQYKGVCFQFTLSAF